MLVHVPAVLSPEEVAHVREVLECTPWADGRATAGEQSALAKYNLQVPEEHVAARELGELILGRLGTNPLFVSAALPLRVFPPLFNRYDEGMRFEAHVDNSIRHVKAAGGMRIRTDLSATLFLSDPDAYDGGALVVEDTYGEHAVKLPAGDMIVYPADSLHRVETVTRGSRWASFFWIQSMVREDGERRLLYDLDRAIQETRGELGDEHHASRALTASYHNLLRRWAEL